MSSKLAVESKARCEKHVVLQCMYLHTIGPRAEVLAHQVKQTLTTLLIYNEKVDANSLGAMTSTAIYLPKRNCNMKFGRTVASVGAACCNIMQMQQGQAAF